MSSAPSSSRPVTSKSRGICKYYTTDRGCFAGKTCKFLHGQVATYTPYDQAKTCRFYAAGFCKRGAQCWFSHAKGKEKEVIDDEDDLCSICFEKPVTYGLLTGCSHIFCITCIKQWRDPVNKSADVVDSGNTKRCPMCRQPAKFIIPSSKFYAQGQEAKDAAMARYMDSMKRVPCKYFQKSLSAPSSTPRCPFGKDCFYQHRNPDGSEHIIDQGIDDSMRLYASQRDPRTLAGAYSSDLIRSLGSVIADLGLHPSRGFPNDGSAEENAVMRRLEILADQMFASLAGQGGQSDSEGETDEEDEAMPPLERIGDHRADDWPLPLMFDSDTDAEMPPLASVSNSSDSEGSEEEEEEDGESSSDGLDDASDERMPTVRPFDLVFDPGMEARNENAGMFVRLSSLWGAAAVREADASSAPESSTRAVNAATGVDVGEEDYADDEADMPPLEHEPPFVTDGRGRVVWSSSSDSGYPRANSSAPRRASGTFPGAFPSGPSSRAMPAEKPPSPRQATGEGGFTTDGRGRVIGTTGTREGEDDETEDSTSEAPVPTRSFFGRVLDAFF